MKIEISEFAIVVILFVLHTIVTHLFNWWFRTTFDDPKGKNLTLFCIILIIMEFILVLLPLNILLR